MLAIPPTVTTTGPVVAPAGTGATMLVALQLLGLAVVLLKVTVLVPWVAPKLEPLIVTEKPTGPDAGNSLVMVAPPETMMVPVEARQLLVSLDSATAPPLSAHAPRKYVPEASPAGIVTFTLPFEFVEAARLGTERVPVSSGSEVVITLSRDKR